MAICICGSSALRFWTQLGIREAGTSRAALDALQVLSPTALGISSADIAPEFYETPGGKDLVSIARSVIPGARPPVDIMTSRTGWRPQAPERRCHAMSAPLPAGSFYWVAPNIAVASPEVVFLELATALSQVRLLRAGFELCGTYSTGSYERTLGGETGPDMPGGLARRLPLTTSERLRDHLGRIAGRPHGLGAAVWAAGRVLDRSASPAETSSALLLCLPRRLGGYGLPRPQLNRRVDVPEPLQPMVGKRYLVCDLYWEGARLDVEYDSDTHHLDSLRAAADARRRNALESLGIGLVSLTTRHLYDAGLFDKAARQMARALGSRQRDRGAYDWEGRRSRLRAELLGS